MKQRGRKSAASQTVSAPGPKRPKAPVELTGRQAAHWKRIAASTTATWFTDATQPLLAEYCRQIVRAEEAEAELQAITKLELPLLERLNARKMALAEGANAARVMVAMARNMRLTQQAQRSADAGTVAAKRATAEKKPWQ